jgi:formylglycine-generating enzyme required for sulfatase activity
MGEKDIVPRESSDLVIRTNNLVRRGLSLLENIEKTDLVIEKASLLLISDTAGQIVQSDQSLSIVLAPGVKMEFVRVPAGEFLMGSREDDPESLYDERPQHKVYLDEYLIGKYPVTNLQYQAFVKASGYKKPSHWINGEIPHNKQDHPVVWVGWEDAIVFCQWASKASSQDIRLPTDAEWEKAARGTDGRTYPWGEGLDMSLANYGRRDTTTVSSYESGKSPYGAYDMAGNVWEWMWDWYNPYLGGNKDASSVFGTKNKALRGGSWDDDGGVISCADRIVDLSHASAYVGFRCARGTSF